MSVSIATQLARIIAGAHDSAGDAPTFIAARAYRWRRGGLRCSAADALRLARVDTAAGKMRYPAWAPDDRAGAPNERGLRYIERPDALGLRFVGFADELAERMYHRGWFTDDDGTNGGTLRGAVWRLPARDGRPVFVGGYRMGDYNRSSRNWSDVNGESAMVNLAEMFRGDAKGDAALSADEDARIDAEREREYQDAWQAGSRYAFLGEAIAAARRDLRALLAERREMRRRFGAAARAEFHASIEAVEDRAAELISDARNGRRDRAELRDRYDWQGGFQPDRQNELRAAFADGADLAA